MTEHPDPRTLARTTDPDTSHAAARKPRRMVQIRTGILHVLADNIPRTLDEIVAEYVERGYVWASASSIRTRVAELRREGKVQRLPGRTARSSMGNTAGLHIVVMDALSPDEVPASQDTFDFGGDL